MAISTKKLVFSNTKSVATLAGKTIKTKASGTVNVYVPTGTSGNFYEVPVAIANKELGTATGQLSDVKVASATATISMCEVTAVMTIAGTPAVAAVAAYNNGGVLVPAVAAVAAVPDRTYTGKVWVDSYKVDSIGTATTTPTTNSGSSVIPGYDDSETTNPFAKAWAWVKENPGKTALIAATITAILVVAFSPAVQRSLGLRKKQTGLQGTKRTKQLKSKK